MKLENYQSSEDKWETIVQAIKDKLYFEGGTMKITDYLWILHPRFWVMVDEYSPIWDAKLNRLMAEHRFTRVGGYVAWLGDQEIWIDNYPYGAFTPGALHVRPSRLTILRARRKLQQDEITAIEETGMLERMYKEKP